MRYLAILWSIILLPMNAQGADISGSYSAFPVSASEEPLMMQNLGGLLAGAEKQTVNVRGRLKAVHITQADGKISVSMSDDTELEILNVTISIDELSYGGRRVVCINRPWTVPAAEGGRTGSGTEVIRMYRETNNDLIVEVESTQITPKRFWRKEKRFITEHTFTFKRLEGIKR